MDLPSGYVDKFRPAAQKTGAPRNQREELIERFRIKLNAEQSRDGRAPYSYGRLAKRFAGWSNSGLFQLHRECSDQSVRSFGAMLTHKLRSGKRHAD